MKTCKRILQSERGDAVVEATILFPIIIMIFAGLCLLAMYLPTRANLQYATQYAATALATQKSDTWLYFDTEDMSYKWYGSRGDLPNVYRAVFASIGAGGEDEADNAEVIVARAEQQGVAIPKGKLTVEYSVINYVVYKELRVTATRAIPSPVNLEFIGFPSEIPVTVTSTAVVLDGDEFVRNMDITRDITLELAEKFHLKDAFDKVKELMGKFNDVLGI